jgi:Leucine-rich repeat (LRR) protein
MPNLTLVDLSNNQLTSFKVYDGIEYLSIQFNPIKKIDIGEAAIKNIKELQIGFVTYKYIYDKYYNNFDHISVQPNAVKLEESLKRLSTVFDDDTINDIYQKFYKTKFPERGNTLLKITLKLYWKYFSSNVNSMKELVETKEFKYLLHNITKLYYKTIVMTMYFNGYLFGKDNLKTQ